LFDGGAINIKGKIKFIRKLSKSYSLKW
jgi:hypothetical protein